MFQEITYIPYIVSYSKSKKESENPVLTEYLDFRRYLRDHYQAKKNADPHYSYQMINQRFELGSRSHYYDIIQGRTLTADYLAKYCHILNLSGRDKEYFLELVRYGQAPTASEKSDALRHLLELSPHLGTLHVDARMGVLFANWYQPLLLSLLELHPKERDHRTIAKWFKPAISAVEARKAIAVLQELGLVNWDLDRHRWILNRKFLKAADPETVPPLRAWQTALIRKGAEIHEQGGSGFSSLTIGTTLQARTRIDGVLARARQEILEIVRQDPGADLVYQVHFHIFPVSEVLPKEPA